MNRNAFIAATLVAAVWLAGCHGNEPPAQATTPKQHVVETVTAHRRQVASQLVLPARVAANPTDMVHIYPLISGRVLSLRILPGQEVHKGESIGTLQSSDAAQARSDFEKARIEADRADLQLNRAKELLAHDVMAQRDYDDLKALDAADHSELERARQTLHMLGFSESDTSDIVPITAPISGVVLDVGTGPGELQRSLDNATAIATIADINSIWVVGDLYPRDQGEVHAGQAAAITVNGYPGMTLHGTVNNISDAVDPVSLTLKVRVVLPNPQHRLKPDMFANMTLTGTQTNVIEVPAASVIQNGRETFVFIQTAPGKYERRNVTLAHTGTETDDVAQGIHDGDSVVSQGAELLREAEDQ
ncbi:MAG TPA: efflux RND transporter periplasmic adaptor subunit [Acidobacteriaceae bacterium]|jgi:cobalt-zinc-cadmium efflux system membrane fusion protein|nr:efflux RND transporter periplasmic adaptor subunit [Acidobacteriaceae bacterium]